MANLATTKMSSGGRVVIPEDIRRRLKLKTGSRFVVLAEDDVVILKVMAPPTIKEFDALIAKVRRQAEESGLKQADLTAAINRARGRA
jgi:AbrB family looped-hinge helix DNA binding protein